jgi:hypothetical protein
MTSEHALRPGRLVCSGMWLPMEITLTKITCRYSNVITEVRFAKKPVVEELLRLTVCLFYLFPPYIIFWLLLTS